MDHANPIQVIKCGGSILADGIDAVADALSTIRGPLVIVVSAPAGETDARFASISLEASTTGDQIAEFVSRGEREMAAHMAGLLQDRGLAARSVTPQEIGLTASGSPLDADPVAIDHQAVRTLLKTTPTLVVPGFVAMGRSGGHKLFGRGGSDTTAVFLATELNATCRLMQAAAGVFDHDPDSRQATRFARMHWDDLLDLDAEVVQHKAVRLAKQQRLRLTVTGLQTTPATLVEDCPSALAGAEPAHVDS